METSQDLFKQLDEAEKLFASGSIKNAQKRVRDVISKTKTIGKVPNKLRHKLNFAIGQSRYFDEMSSFAANPKREELISEINNIILNPLSEPKKQANTIHDIQTKWQLLDLSSRPASRDQWSKFNELTNKAWEPCKEYFDELKEIKITNANERMLIVNNINEYVERNSSKWPNVRTLIQFLRQSFDKWQEFAPVLDKDLNKLKSAYFEARKPINDHIKKQEQLVVNAKESLIAKVEAISSDDNDLCIKLFNDLKNDWKMAGSAGRKLDNKLWDRFNKSADRFFNAKKEVVDAEITLIKELQQSLKANEKSVHEVESELSELKNISKTQEFKSIKDDLYNVRNKAIKETKELKVKSYLAIYDLLNTPQSEINNLPKVISSAIEKSWSNKKTKKDNLLYSCIKLEILASLESLKKDFDLRQKIQLEMLSEKFNKSASNLSTLDDLIIHFIENFSEKDAGAPEKKLWDRATKAVEILLVK